MRKRGIYGAGRVYQPKYKAADGSVKTVGKFYIQYYDKEGNQRREPTDARTEKEARHLLSLRLGQVQQGTVAKVDEKSLRYGDLREDVLRYFRVNKMASLEHYADGTEYAKGLAALDEFFGYKGPEDKGTKIAAFSGAHWDDNFITRRRKEGVSDATIINSAKLLDRMFKLAIENGRIISAPKITIPSAPAARKEYLTKEQFDLLLGPKGMDKRFHPLLTFLFYQGVRIGETLNIKWNQLDLTDPNNGVFLPDAAQNKTGNKDAKPLQKEVVQALSRLAETEEYVFEDARSNGEHPEKKFEKAFRKAVLKLGFGKLTWCCSQCRTTKDAAAPNADSPAIACPKCKDVPMQFHYVGPTPHSLRASTVVFYREGRMSDAEIMAITGHKSLKSFLGYSRTRVENLKQSMDAAATMRKKVQSATAKANRPQLVA